MVSLSETIRRLTSCNTGAVWFLSWLVVRTSVFEYLFSITYCANDVDFGLNKAEIRSSKFISKVISREVDDELVEKDAEWKTKIRGRPESIIALEEALDTEFLIYKFDSRKVPHGSNIEAKYVIKNVHTGITFFVFVDEDASRWFSRSIFQLNVADYSVNQARVTGLKKKKKQKRKMADVVIDYTHPNYKPNTLVSRSQLNKLFSE